MDEQKGRALNMLGPGITKNENHFLSQSPPGSQRRKTYKRISRQFLLLHFDQFCLSLYYSSADSLNFVMMFSEM
jgi:hypothetical protein